MIYKIKKIVIMKKAIMKDFCQSVFEKSMIEANRPYYCFINTNVLKNEYK